MQVRKKAPENACGTSEASQTSTPESEGPAMNDRTPDLGTPHRAGHPSGRFWPEPVSIEQARARVMRQMDHLEMACRDHVDVGYAQECLDEAEDDYRQIVLGTIR
jgi:hypothetical protein